MPVMDGLEATVQIIAKKIKEGPTIVALTAYATDNFNEKCAAAGMERMLTKPISSDQIAKVLTEKNIII